MKKRFTEQQIVAILKEAEAGVAAKDICREHNMSDATFYIWRKEYRGIETEDLRRLRQLEEEHPSSGATCPAWSSGVRPARARPPSPS